MSLILRVARAGLVAALLVALVGWAVERYRFGATDQETLARVERELRERFEASANTLGTIAARAASERDAVRAAPRDQAAVKRLFDAADAALRDEPPGRTGITIYDSGAAPLAWAGRVSDLPRARVDGPSALFVACARSSALVRVEPVTEGGRIATIVVEQTLGTVQGGPGVADTFVLSTSLVPVTIRAQLGREPVACRPPPAPAAPYSFVIPSRGGGLLVEAQVSPGRPRGGARHVGAECLRGSRSICHHAAVVRRADHRTTAADATRGAISSTTAVVAAGAGAHHPVVAVSPFVGLCTIASPLDLLRRPSRRPPWRGLRWTWSSARRVARPRPRLLTPGRSIGRRVRGVLAAAGLLGGWLLWLRTDSSRSSRTRRGPAPLLVIRSARGASASRLRSCCSTRRSSERRARLRAGVAGSRTAHVVTAIDRRGLVDRRRGARHDRSAAAGPDSPGLAALGGARVRRRLRRPARPCQPSLASCVAGRPARRVVRGPARTRDSDVPVAVCLRHQRQRAADRGRVRTSGVAPARRSEAEAGAYARPD